MLGRYFFTSEAVTEGHPDKVCDQISDTILDAILEQDPQAHCACEVTADPQGLRIMGEISANANVDYEALARQVIREIGYTDSSLGFSDASPIRVTIHEQSPDIAMGVDKGDELDSGAGDQGMMFGYASNETEVYMPLAAYLSHELCKRLTLVRKEGILNFLRPDGKAQVTVAYQDGVPKYIDAVVLSAQHDPSISTEDLRFALKETVIDKVLPKHLVNEKTRYYINPTGRFVLGGPAADSGLTGRKIICDTYGGYARHGGGAFSGKDPSKVDRSAAYMARYIAKHIVAAELAPECEVQLSYAIGVAEPMSIYLSCPMTSKVSAERLTHFVRETMDLRPAAIIKTLDLRKPRYRETSNNGHFGRTSEAFSWEKLDDALLNKLKALVV